MEIKERKIIIVYTLLACGYLLMNSYDLLFKTMIPSLTSTLIEIIFSLGILFVFYKAKYYQQKLGLISMIITSLNLVEAVITFI